MTPTNAGVGTTLLAVCVSTTQNPVISFGVMALVIVTCFVVLAHILISCWISNKRTAKKQKERTNARIARANKTDIKP